MKLPRSFHNSRLRKQYFLVVALCLLLNMAAWLLGEFILLPGFAERERVRAERHLQRIGNFLAREGEHLGRMASTIAPRVPAMQPSVAGECIRLADVGLQTDLQKIDVLMLLNAAGRMVSGCDLDPRGAQFFTAMQASDSWQVEDTPRSGLHGVGKDIWLLATAPVGSSGVPGVGSLLLGRRLDATRMAILEDVLEYDMQLSLIPWSAGQESKSQETRVEATSPGHLLARTLLDDFDGVSRIEITLRLGRESMQQGRLTVKAMQFWVAGLSVLFGGLAMVGLRLLDRGAERSLVLNELMERSSEALLLVLPDGTISAANPRARKLLGIAAGQPEVLQRIDELLFGLGEGRLSATIASPTESRRTSIELPLAHGGRALIEVDAVEVVLDGRAHLLLQLRDVSLRQEADRLSRLASLGELAAGVAHEVNNPIGMIQRNLDFVRDVLDDALPLLAARDDAEQIALGGVDFAVARDQLPQLLEDMSRGSRRIGDIVRDLKDFAREDSFDREAVFDLNVAVNAAVRLLDGTIRKSTDHFSTELVANLPPTHGKLRQIEQVVLNLVQNACQALPERGGTIRVITSHHSGDCTNQLQVIDTGTGVSEELLERIVEPFFTTRRDSGGTGLGLSVSMRIVRNHRGTLHFASRPGQGTSVTLTLPAAKE